MKLVMDNDCIINADDFGLSPSVNLAILKCFEKGYISRTTIMANMPHYNNALELCHNTELKQIVGLHLTLDEGKPLTDKIKNNSHFCSDGQFVKGWFTIRKRKVYLNPYDRICLQEEILAQMMKYVNDGFVLMHIDSHHLFHTASPLYTYIVIKCAKKCGFQSMRTCGIYKKDGLLSAILKKVVHLMIRCNFKTTSKFFPYSSMRNNQDLINAEIMVHPDFVDDCLVDVISRASNKYISIPR